MAEYEQALLNFLSRLESAFPVQPRPTQKELDFDQHHRELGFLVNPYDHRAHQWDEVPLEAFRDHADGFTHLFGAGFVYFLPGYLRACVTSNDSVSASASIVSAMNLYGSFGNMHRKQIVLLNSNQFACVVNFIELLIDRTKASHRLREMQFTLASLKKAFPEKCEQMMN